MEKKNYVALSVRICCFTAEDVIKTSLAQDGIFDDTKNVKNDTDWFGQ